MFSYCTSNISGIQFLLVDNEKITLTEGKLKDRMAAAGGIPGTRQFHCFVPISLSSMNVYKYSLQAEQPMLFRTGFDDDSDTPENSDTILSEVKVGNFVCCHYDNHPWIETVENDSSEFGDYWIKFMHPHGPASNFSWPDKDDHVWVIQENIYYVVNAPGFTSSSSRTYSVLLPHGQECSP